MWICYWFSSLFQRTLLIIFTTNTAFFTYANIVYALQSYFMLIFIQLVCNRTFFIDYGLALSVWLLGNFCSQCVSVSSWFWCYAGAQKACGTISLIKTVHSTVIFDTGLPKDQKCILAGVQSCSFCDIYVISHD